MFVNSQVNLLGSLFWNVVYDSLLEMTLHNRVKIISFTDDDTIVEQVPLERRMMESIRRRVRFWMHNKS